MGACGTNTTTTTARPTHVFSWQRHKCTIAMVAYQSSRGRDSSNSWSIRPSLDHSPFSETKAAAPSSSRPLVGCWLLAASCNAVSPPPPPDRCVLRRIINALHVPACVCFSLVRYPASA